ncbi:MAG: hypothetical protein ACT4QF_24565 [Sporichthyaceae bacterium]
MCAGFALSLLWLASRPAFPVWDLILPVGSLLLLALLWFLRLVSLAVLRTGLDRRWLVAPVGGLLTAVLVVSSAPLQARFTPAQSELGRVARQVLAAPDPAEAALERGDLGRVGTYRVKAVRVIDGSVFFTFGKGHGMAYAPTADAEALRYTRDLWLGHLRGPWHTWQDGDFHDLFAD